MDVMYSMYFVFSYFICPVYCSIDTNACQYVRIKKLLLDCSIQVYIQTKKKDTKPYLNSVW